MQVLHITSSYNGGIYSFIKSKYKYFDSNEVVFDILALEEAPTHVREIAQRNNSQLFHLNNPKKHGYKLFMDHLNRILKDNKYDAVHCHFNGYRALPFFYASKKEDIPFIIHAHNSGETESQNLFKSTLMSSINRKLNRFMTQHPVSCSDLATKYVFGKKWDAADKVTILPNSIDPENYSLEENLQLKKNLGFREDEIIIGQVGRLDPNKNQLFTLQLAKEMLNIRKDFKWIIIGEGRDKHILRKQIKELNLDSTVRLLGRKDPISDYYRIMDSLVFPSKSEGFGIVALEAQASGLPCLLSDTITKEVDLGLGLLTYLPLSNKEHWVRELQKEPRKLNLSEEDILASLNTKYLTNKKAAEKYKEFLKSVTT